MDKLSHIQKEFQILNHLLINMTGKEKIIRQKQMTAKCSIKITRQLLLILFVLNKKKYTLLIFQNLIQPVKNK